MGGGIVRRINVFQLIHVNFKVIYEPGSQLIMRSICIMLYSTIMMALFASCADYDLLEDPDRTPDPVVLEITAVTDSSVTVRWTQCRDDDFKQYAVYYGTNDIVDRDDKLADSLSFSVDTVKTVRPLDDLTRYYFRVIVYNDQGNFSVSNIVDTVTPEDMKGKLKLSRPQVTADGDVTLLWTAALETVDRYAVHADTLRTVDTADSIYATVYSDTTETISGLAAGHTWYFKVVARTDTTVAATSNIVDIELPVE